MALNQKCIGVIWKTISIKLYTVYSFIQQIMFVKNMCITTMFMLHQN